MQTGLALHRQLRAVWNYQAADEKSGLSKPGSRELPATRKQERNL